MSSDCSSGCQSGWTMYLVPSTDENDSFYYYNGGGDGFGRDWVRQEEEEEEEGQSMISDACSGPRFYSVSIHQHAAALCPDDSAEQKRSGVRVSRMKKRPDNEQRERRSSALDDTASSQLFSNSKNSFDDCNYRLKKQQQQHQSAEVEFSAHLEEQIGYSCVKPTPSRPVTKKKGGRKM